MLAPQCHITALTTAAVQVRGEVGLVDGGRVPGRFVVDVGAGTGLSLAKPFVESNHLRQRSGPTIHRRAGTGVGGTMYADVARIASCQDIVIKLTTKRLI